MYWKRTLRIVHFIQMCILQFFFSIMQGLIPFWIIFNFLLSLTYLDKWQFFRRKSFFMRLIKNYFFRNFLKIHPSFSLVGSNTNLCQRNNSESCQTFDILLTPTWTLQSSYLNWWFFHSYFLWFEWLFLTSIQSHN